MFSGGDSHARRKCDMFSICIKGMFDFLNLMPGGGRARFARLSHIVSALSHTVYLMACNTHLHRAVPSLSASSKSPAASFSPSVSSIHMRVSFAAFGVYRSMRNLFMSWSREETDAMAEIGLQGFAPGGLWKRCRVFCCCSCCCSVTWTALLGAVQVDARFFRFSKKRYRLYY
jgi:hypothetical protein